MEWIQLPFSDAMNFAELEEDISSRLYGTTLSQLSEDEALIPYVFRAVINYSCQLPRRVFDSDSDYCEPSSDCDQIWTIIVSE